MSRLSVKPLVDQPPPSSTPDDLMAIIEKVEAPKAALLGGTLAEVGFVGSGGVIRNYKHAGHEIFFD
ncbi:MAG: hypothetical protein ACLQO1_25045 [Steroidobacteraceae bacterium]